MGVKLGAILCTAMVALTLNGGTPNEKSLVKRDVNIIMKM